MSYGLMTKYPGPARWKDLAALVTGCAAAGLVILEPLSFQTSGMQSANEALQALAERQDAQTPCDLNVLDGKIISYQAKDMTGLFKMSSKAIVKILVNSTETDPKTLQPSGVAFTLSATDMREPASNREEGFIGLTTLRGTSFSTTYTSLCKTQPAP